MKKPRDYSTEQLRFDSKILNIRDLFIIHVLKIIHKVHKYIKYKTLIQHIRYKESENFLLSRKKLYINQI